MAKRKGNPYKPCKTCGARHKTGPCPVGHDPDDWTTTRQGRWRQRNRKRMNEYAKEYMREYRRRAK